MKSIWQASLVGVGALAAFDSVLQWLNVFV